MENLKPENGSGSRRSIRLAGYDYSKEGMYFITICCDGNECRFGKIRDDVMILNTLGEIAENEWRNLVAWFGNIELGEYRIMPNHMHGIIIINPEAKTKTFPESSEEAGTRFPAEAGIRIQTDAGIGNLTKVEIEKRAEADIEGRAEASPAPTIGDMICTYKSLSSNKCLDIFKARNKRMGKIWQRDYYEHIIRNDESYRNISEYIINNVVNWRKDRFFV